MDFASVGYGIWLTAICGLLLYIMMVLQKRRRNPPGPMGLPLVGYLPFMGKHAPTTFYELSKKFGPVISVKLVLNDFVILNDYDSIHEAFVKRGDVFSGRPPFPINLNSKEPGKQEGISARNYGEIYKKHRKFALTTLRSFGFGKRCMEDKITEEMKFFTDAIQSKNGLAFDCQTLLSTTVSNIMCSIVLGTRFAYDDEVFTNMIKKLNHAFSDEKDALGLTLINMLPCLRFVPPFSSIFHSFMEDVRYIEGVLKKAIEERKLNKEDGDARDFIGAFLSEMEKQAGKDASFNERQLLQVLRDFFVAGSETTSSTLRWVILLFGHRADIQKKVAKEIDEVIGDATPALKHRDEMPYICAFLHEITRHRTLAPLSLPHKTTADVSFRGYHVAKNTTVFPNLWAVHNDPDNFKDPSEFKPERFIDENGKFFQHKHVIPFSIGPRYCLGENLVKMELFLFVTNIVQKFKIVPDPRKQLPSFNESVPGVAEVPRHYEVSFIVRQ